MTLSIRVPRDLYEGSSDFSEVTQFEVNRSSSELGGTSDDIDVSELLPDMKVYDYFETIKNMFNLIIVPDERNKTVLIQNRDEYFNQQFRLIDDWHIDEDSEVKIEPMSEVDFKTYQLTYSKDADDMNNVVDDVDLLGSKIIDIQNDFLI